MYKYETHCHTARTSLCGRMSAEDIVELYIANGYTGVFITDHFLNGNTTVHKTMPNAPYAEKIEEFCKGYEEVKLAAKDRLQVFFGLEFSYKGTDVLCYGWNKEQLKNMPEIMNLTMRQFCDYCRENGALAVQAHPFREDFYIDHIRLFPNAEGVEVFNAGRNRLCNDLGNYYALQYGKIRTGGSDLHVTFQPVLSGMEFSEKIRSEQHFISLLRKGEGNIFSQPNRFLNREKSS